MKDVILRAQHYVLGGIITDRNVLPIAAGDSGGADDNGELDVVQLQHVPEGRLRTSMTSASWRLDGSHPARRALAPLITIAR